MSLVDTETGEVMGREEAEAITRQIKVAAEDLWRLLERAHNGCAYLALGYGSWAEYLAAEFDISRSRGYRLVAHARAVRALSAATGVAFDDLDLSERWTREDWPDDGTVPDEVVRAAEAAPPETRAEAVARAARNRAARIRAAAARRALRREEEAKEARKSGGDTAAAYAAIRKAASALDHHLGEVADRAEQAAVREALAATHKAEDAIVSALRIGRTA